MASKHYITATLDWAKVFEQNRDKKGPHDAWVDKGGACTVTAWLDKEAQKAFKESGSRLSYLKKYDEEEGEKITQVDDKGRKAIQFRRYFINEKFPNYGGEPEIVHEDGTPWDIEEDGLIGNGSVGIVCFTTYDTNTGVGTRLEGIQVLEHVPYESDYEPAHKSNFQPRDGAKPRPAPKAKAPKKEPVPADLDDDIPF